MSRVVMKDETEKLIRDSIFPYLLPEEKKKTPTKITKNRKQASSNKTPYHT